MVENYEKSQNIKYKAKRKPKLKFNWDDPNLSEGTLIDRKPESTLHLGHFN